MDVFISWSGERSKQMAEVLNGWLPLMFHAVRPWMSSEAIEKGARGEDEINNALREYDFGISCLTSDNLDSRWILYEAGALAKKDASRLWTLLLDLRYSDVEKPLEQFQHTTCEKDDFFKMVKSINEQIRLKNESNLTVENLTKIYEMMWPELEPGLKVAKDMEPESPRQERSDRDILEEILESVRQKKAPRLIMREDMRTELANMELAIAALMAAPDQPIRDLQNDPRVIRFVNSAKEATNDMSNSGLIIVDKSVLPLSEFLNASRSKHYYWVESNGRVHQEPF